MKNSWHPRQQPELGAKQWVRRVFASGGLSRYLHKAQEIGEHTFWAILLIAAIWVIHYVQVLILGPNFLLYDLLPLRYLIDSADLAILLRFVWCTVSSIGAPP